jgi:predicted nucleic acid-binding protein
LFFRARENDCQKCSRPPNRLRCGSSNAASSSAWKASGALSPRRKPWTRNGTDDVYLDTGVLVSTLYVRDDRHTGCLDLLESGDALASAHALAETVSTLTGQYGVKNDVASEAVWSLTGTARVESLSVADYPSVLENARARGGMVGFVYDALQAQVARRLKVEALYTFNLSNFAHVAEDLDVREP